MRSSGKPRANPNQSYQFRIAARSARPKKRHSRIAHCDMTDLIFSIHIKS